MLQQNACSSVRVITVARMRELEKYEVRALEICTDPEYREKLRLWVQKKKEPLDDYGLKKLKDKIDAFERKHVE